MSHEPTCFETERLQARRFRSDDVDAILEIYSDPEVVRFLTGRVIQDREGAEARLRAIEERFPITSPHCFLALVEKRSQQIIGCVGLMPARMSAGVPRDDCVSLLIILVRRVWGLGYAFEATKGLIEFGFQRLDVAELHGLYELGNERIHRMAERMDMRYLGTTTRYFDTELKVWVATRPLVPSRG